MAENFFILRRTAEEKKVFGGDVYIDIDGKNIGILGETDFGLNLPKGDHTLKMYKSHKMGTFIGTAETRFTLENDEKLFARYSSPLMINQSGTIIVSKYESRFQLDNLSTDISRRLDSDYHEEETIRIKKEEKIKEGNNAIIWFIVISALLGLIYWIITMNQINSLF